MLNFFRKNAAIIGWTLLIFFGATMLAGSFYLGFFDDRPKELAPKGNVSNFASLGETPIDSTMFNQLVQANLQTITQEGARVSPIQLEYIIMNSFNAAMRNTAYLIDMKDSDIAITKQERSANLREFLIQNNFKSEKELKIALKERSISYKDFYKQMEQELLIRKFKSDLVSSVKVSDKLLFNAFRKISFNKIDIIILDKKETNLDALLSSIETDIKTKELSVVKAQYKDKAMIQDMNSNGFYAYFDLVSTYRYILYDLNVGEFSKMMKEKNYYVMFQALSFKTEEKPKNFNNEEFTKQILARLQQEALEAQFNTVLELHPLTIYIPEVKAVYEKYQGNLDAALNAYQEVISNRPETPVPHFFRADIFNKLQQKSEVLKELETADIKSQLDAQFDFPELHLFYAEQLKDIDTKKAIEQYEKAMKLVPNEANFLQAIKNAFIDLNHTSGVLAVDKMLMGLEAANKKAAQDSKPTANVSAKPVVKTAVNR
jgi:tetratricopeptide (TPR) repeat protein